MTWWSKFKAGFKHAFAIGVKEELTSEERAVLEKVAARIRARGLQLPAVVFLESARPLNMLGSQVMIGLQPFVELVASTGDYDALASALEKRISIDILMRLLEDAGPRT
ncbi:MAG TPA: hypothetical protein VI643_03040 [Planctomycetota bacterium]|nr:hypothetical protein [Planctomycetota bacterium]